MFLPKRSCRRLTGLTLILGVPVLSACTGSGIEGLGGFYQAIGLPPADDQIVLDEDVNGDGITNDDDLGTSFGDERFDDDNIGDDADDFIDNTSDDLEDEFDDLDDFGDDDFEDDFEDNIDDIGGGLDDVGEDVGDFGSDVGDSFGDATDDFGGSVGDTFDDVFKQK